MHFIALHGFTQRADKFAERAGLPEACEALGWTLHTPQAKNRNWRPSRDAGRLAEFGLSLGGPVIWAGFSDGARTALCSAILMPATIVAAVVFHSGMFHRSDVDHLTYLPWHFLAVGGRNSEDGHGPNPFAAFQWADALAEKAIGPSIRDVSWYPHKGGHEWGQDQNEVIFDFCRPREVGHVA